MWDRVLDQVAGEEIRKNEPEEQSVMSVQDSSDMNTVNRMSSCMGRSY